MHGLTRRLLQAWTIRRLRALQPRFARCVDLGCGFGDWTAQFAEIADEVHGCEVASAFVERARQRLPSAHIACCDLLEYEIPANTDLVYLGAVLMYVDDDDALAVLRRIRAAVAPGAYVVWRDFCAFNLGHRAVNRARDRFSVHRRPSELRELARRAGLEVLELRASPSIYAEVLGGRWLQWPLRAVLRLATLGWCRASHTLVMRAP